MLVRHDARGAGGKIGEFKGRTSGCPPCPSSRAGIGSHCLIANEVVLVFVNWVDSRVRGRPNPQVGNLAPGMIVKYLYAGKEGKDPEGQAGKQRERSFNRRSDLFKCSLARR